MTSPLLFQDLLESRLFRSPSSLEKYSVDKMCEIAYLYMLMLCMLLIVDNNFARKYAVQTLTYPDFDGIRFSSTDLGNLLAGITHADRYFNSVPKVLPLLQIKRLFRDIKNDQVDRARLRSIMAKLQDLFKLHSGNYNKLRRDIVDFDKCDAGDRRIIADQLYRQIRRIEVRGDLVLQLHNYLESKK